MRYWFDTEFCEDGRTIDLISIGIVAEDGREYYAVSQEFNGVKVFDNPWLVENVVPFLPYKRVIEIPGDYTDSDISRFPRTWVEAEPDYSTGLWKPRGLIRQEVIRFLSNLPLGGCTYPRDDWEPEKPEIWAYYADYDWVALCQLFGKMIDLPRGFPMYCRDIKQLADMLGNPKLPEQDSAEHHALADARWNRIAWKFLNDRFAWGLYLSTR
jgi:hypothetical protein